MANDQRDAQIPFYVGILFITLYRFRAHRAHQERQNVSIRPMVTIYVGGRVVCTLEVDVVY